MSDKREYKSWRFKIPAGGGPPEPPPPDVLEYYRRKNKGEEPDPPRQEYKWDHLPILRKRKFSGETDNEPGNGIWKLIIEFCAS